MDEDLSHQAARAGIPQSDLLGPLGGEVHQEKGFGGDFLGPLGGEGHRVKLKDLYSKILEEQAVTVRNKGTVLSTF